MKRVVCLFTAVLLAFLAISEPFVANESIGDELQNKAFVIVLDPGHGGSDPGAVRTHNGITYRERDLVLKIANYCKEELLKNPNVEVYLTRENNTDKLQDRKERIEFAKKVNADIVVSLHLNSTGETSTTANGAEIYYPNANFNTSVHENGKTLATKILGQLTTLGLKNRGIVIRNSNESTYADGSVADYLGIIYYAKKEGIPSVLVEHGFINNANDVNNYFSSDEKLKQLGIANAKGILEYLDIQDYRWQQDEKGWKCLHKNEYIVNQWHSINGKWYYFDVNGYRYDNNVYKIGGYNYSFDANGVMAIGWSSHYGKWYYADSNGRLITGWKYLGGKWYFFNSDGLMQTGLLNYVGRTCYFNTSGELCYGLHNINGTYYYFGNDGYAVSGEVQVKDAKYHFDASGKGTTGWIKKNGEWYYYNAGKMQTGWQRVYNKWYYLNAKGVMQTGWQTIGGYRYYLNSNGEMQTGIQTIQGNKYLFTSSGDMLTGWRTVDNNKYYFDNNGKAKTGWFVQNADKYYFDTNGAMSIGWKQINGSWYYFNTAGKMQTGWQRVYNKWYYMNKNGVMLTGWQTIDGNRYYLNGNGEMLSGIQTIQGNRYFFASSGELKTGWQRYNNKWYYMNSNGVMQTGWQWIDGHYYFLNGNGEMLTGIQTINRKIYGLSSSGEMQTGWSTFDGNKYYFSESGAAEIGWLQLNKDKYYFNVNGIMQTDWVNVSGTWHYMNENGVWQENPPTLPPSDELTLIVNSSYASSNVTAQQMADFLTGRGYSYPEYYKTTDAPTLEILCQMYIDEANTEGIRADVAFCQMILETGYLQYKNCVVKIEQNNFAGIGATDDGATPNSFTTVREGIRAQIQHLKAYASTDELVNEVVDPRFHLVKRGSASYVEWLGIQENPEGFGWASGKDYGYKIMRLLNSLNNPE